MKRWLVLLSVLLLWTSVASSDYVLVLKNGRRIIAQSYREEGSTIKFHGLGGEIGINKDQIQSIRKAGAEERSKPNALENEQPSPSFDAQAGADRPKSPQPTVEKSLSSEEQRAKEEKDYQEVLKTVTQQLQQARDRYAAVIRGTPGKDPTLLTDEERLKALTDDLIARRKDAEQNPTDPGVLRLLTPSPFTGQPPTTIELRAPTPVGPAFATPPPEYTDRQKQLSDLRNQAIQLEKERERLIEEMKQKNFNTGSLFLE